MPVHNALPYLNAAVESILSQTYADFEFIIRDDGSTDGSLEVLRSWASRDQRIRLFVGPERLGPARSSNWVVSQAAADFVARMDADDISLPFRLARQLQILENNPEAVLTGSIPQGIDSRGRVVYDGDLSGIIAGGLSAPFSHGSIMFRRAAFQQAGGYRDACNFWEDLDLYARMRAIGRILISVQPLYQHRFSETSTRLTSETERVEAAVDLMFRCRTAFEETGDYEPLLAIGGNTAQSGERLDPRVFLSLAFIRFWSGHRPHAIMRLLQRGRLRPDRISFQILLWALLAEASPKMLRHLMQRRLRQKNARARRRLPSDGVCEWRPNAGS